MRPDVILILTDDQTMESVARMPYVSSRTDWISFDQAYINNGLCCPLPGRRSSPGMRHPHARGDERAGGLLNERETPPVWLSRAGIR